MAKEISSAACGVTQDPDNPNHFTLEYTSRKASELKNIILAGIVDEADGAFTMQIKVNVKNSKVPFDTPLNMVAIPDVPADPTKYTLKEVPIEINTAEAPFRSIYEVSDQDRAFSIDVLFAGAAANIKAKLEVVDA